MKVTEFDIASRRERTVATLIVLIMVTLGLALLPIAGTMAETMPSFRPTVVTVATVFALLTAYLLATQWRLLQNPAQGILSSAYFYLGMCLAGQSIFFPTLSALNNLPDNSVANANIWLSMMWHLALPVFALLYAWLQSGLRFSTGSVRTIAWSTLLLICITYSLVQSGILPPLVEDGHYLPLYTHNLAYWIFGLSLFAATVLALRTGGRIRQDLWLAVILLSFAIETLVSLQGFARYSIGFYAGRIFMLNGVGLMLIVLIHSLVLMSQNLQVDNRALNRVALTDALTSLGNRRNFDEKLQIYQRLIQRDGCPIALLLIDIDFFKQFNDTYGHPAGDACLKRVAALLAQQVFRPLDTVARIGGEEFALLLPDTSSQNAMLVADRLRLAIAQQRIPHRQGLDGRVTVSVGVAVLEPGSPMTVSHLVSQADHALYQAKQGGRNRTALSALPALATAVA